MVTFLASLESGFLLFIQDVLRIPVLNEIFIFITHLGDKGILWILLALLLIVIPKYRKNGIAMSIALIIGLIITNVLLKNIVSRIRPYEIIEGLKPLIERQSDWSFPSGHATGAMAAGVTMLCTMPKHYGIPVFILSILVSLSRLYVGVHFPSDVIAGMIIGTFAAYCGIKLSERINKKL